MNPNPTPAVPAPSDWKTSLPEGWRAAELRRVGEIAASNVDKNTVEGERPVQLCNYTDVYYNDRITQEIEFMSATATPREVSRFRLSGGEVLLTKDSETAEDIAIPAFVEASASGDEPLVCGYHLYLVRPDVTQLDGRFLMRACSVSPIRDQFVVAANGITRYGLGLQDLGSSSIPLPPLDLQRIIADFLDRETTKIDTLVAQKQRLIELLQEKRTALVTQAVTKGLDPDVEMKDSGVEWLGEIPAHWEAVQLKYLAELQTGLTLGKTYQDATVTRPYLRVANVQVGHVQLDDVTEIDVPPSVARRYALQRGDVLMTEGGDFDKLGRGTVWNGQLPDCLHQNHIFAVRPRKRLQPKFLSTVLESLYGRAYFTATSKQSTNLASTSSTKVRSFPIPVPPVEEQAEIIDGLDKRLDELQQLVSQVQHAITLLTEYRTALISAAVTGKIDVRTTEASP